MFEQKLKQTNEALYNEAIRHLAEDGLDSFSRLDDYDKEKLATLLMDDCEFFTETQAHLELIPLLQTFNLSRSSDHSNDFQNAMTDLLTNKAIEYYKDRIDRDLHDEYLNQQMWSDDYATPFDEHKYFDDVDRARAVNDVKHFNNY